MKKFLPCSPFSIMVLTGSFFAIALTWSISANGPAFADSIHCDRTGSPSCYSVGFSDGQANPGTSCPSGHSLNYCTGWRAAAGNPPLIATTTISPVQPPHPPLIATTTISPVPPPSYIVRLESIPIVAKMSEGLGLGRDTDYASMAVALDDGHPVTASKFLGDLDSGFTHPCADGIKTLQICNPPIFLLGPFPVASGHNLDLSYDILNHGGGGSGEKTAFDVATGLLLPNILSSWPKCAEITSGTSNACPQNKARLGFETFFFPHQLLEIYLKGIFTPGACNGVAASDAIQLSSDRLAQLTSATGRYTETREYFGGVTPPGCGGGSHYMVTWSIDKVGTQVP